MRRLLALAAVCFFLSVAGETAHVHADSHEAPCPAACLGAGVGAYCDISAAGIPSPEIPEKVVFAGYSGNFVPQALEDEIFHPPAA